MKIKMRTIAGFTTVCIILALIISVSIIKLSNGTNFQIMSVENNSTSRMKASYRYYSGTKMHKIYMKQGEILKIHFTSEVKKGDLVINILDYNDEIVKTLNSNIEGNAEIKAEADGNYIIKIIGDKTRGSYEVNWTK